MLDDFTLSQSILLKIQIAYAVPYTNSQCLLQVASETIGMSDAFLAVRLCYPEQRAIRKQSGELVPRNTASSSNASVALRVGSASTSSTHEPGHFDRITAALVADTGAITCA